MLRSMFAGISGLRGHQTMMDVVSNNISNVNTAGYKQSRATFQEALVQTMRGAAGAGEAQGGVNPYQLGLGANVAGVDTVFSQGSTQTTGRNTDLAINGEGFFAVERDGQVQYTRAGAFNLDEAGSLVNAGGGRVLGYGLDANGEVDPAAAPGPLELPMGQTIDPDVTEQVRVGGNLDAAADVGAAHNSSITVYDSQGVGHELALRWEKTGGNAWDLTATAPDGTEQTYALTFDGEGALTSPGELNFTFDPADADPVALTLDLAGNTPLTQYEGSFTAEARGQDGAPMGFLRGFEFGADGTVTGRFSNGESEVLGAVAVATFDNPGGLEREGESMYAATVNSGQPIVGLPAQGGVGTITPGALEMSNVDLAQEFTNLIIAQRGFQANSRTITTSDELLQELVQMKR